MKRIFSWNVNGIRAINRKGFRSWLAKTNPDILVIQETKAHIEQLDEDLKYQKNYKSYFFSAAKLGYSGVALYTKTEPISVEPLGVRDFDIEGRTLIAHYPGFILINCYFPNSQREAKRIDYKLAFCDAVLEKCNQFANKGHKILLCGDYNIAHKPIDLTNPKKNEHNPGYLPQERAWMTKFLEAGYVDVFRHYHPDEPGHYTWWSYMHQARSKDIGWRIDYTCVSKELLSAAQNVKIHKGILGSDHCPISIDLNV